MVMQQASLSMPAQACPCSIHPILDRGWHLAYTSRFTVWWGENKDGERHRRQVIKKSATRIKRSGSGTYLEVAVFIASCLVLPACLLASSLRRVEGSSEGKVTNRIRLFVNGRGRALGFEMMYG